MLYFTQGVTDDMRQKQKDQLFGVTREDLIHVARTWVSFVFEALAGTSLFLTSSSSHSLLLICGSLRAPLIILNNCLLDEPAFLVHYFCHLSEVWLLLHMTNLFSAYRYLASSDIPNSIAVLGPGNKITARDSSWTIRRESLTWNHCSSVKAMLPGLTGLQADLSVQGPVIH